MLYEVVHLIDGGIELIPDIAIKTCVWGISVLEIYTKAGSIIRLQFIGHEMEILFEILIIRSIHVNVVRVQSCVCGLYVCYVAIHILRNKSIGRWVNLKDLVAGY